jgi:putative cell wall-binding protein
MKASKSVLTVMVAFALVFTVVSPAFAWLYDGDPNRVVRLSGADRYETNIATSVEGFPNGAVVAVIVTGANWPDALCAVPLAGAQYAPLLLTPPDTFKPELKAELQRLGVGEAYIIGGTGAISEMVEAEIKKLDIVTIRLAGTSRYETAARVAAEMDRIVGASITGRIIVSGENYPDALSVSPFAALHSLPILLTPSRTTNTHTMNALKDTEMQYTYFIGGTAAISESVAKEYDDANPANNVIRVAGENRYETSRLWAERVYGVEYPARTSAPAPWMCIGFASGVNYPDALGAGAVLGGALTWAGGEGRHGALILNDPDKMNANTQAFLNKYDGQIDKAYVFGGTSAMYAAFDSAVAPYCKK